MTRLRGRSRKGARLRAKAPSGHWGTQTFIAGLRRDRLSAPWFVDKAMKRTAFEVYVETQLAPTLNKGDVVILDKGVTASASRPVPTTTWSSSIDPVAFRAPSPANRSRPRAGA